MSAIASPRYPVAYEADYVEQRSRLTTFFRLVMIIPQLILGYALGIAIVVTVLISWFALLFTARYPEGLYGFNSDLVRWQARLQSYEYLLTDVYPPFGIGEHPEYPVRVTFAPRLEHYSRARVFFRGVLLVVLYPISFVYSALLTACAVGAWFYIMVKGRQHPGLQTGMVVAMAWSTRFSAYLALLTEHFPPFLPSGEQLLGPPRIDGPAPGAFLPPA